MYVCTVLDLGQKPKSYVGMVFNLGLLITVIEKLFQYQEFCKINLYLLHSVNFVTVFSLGYKRGDTINVQLVPEFLASRFTVPLRHPSVRQEEDRKHERCESDEGVQEVAGRKLGSQVDAQSFQQKSSQ